MLTHQNRNTHIQMHHPASPNTHTHIHISHIAGAHKHTLHIHTHVCSHTHHMNTAAQALRHTAPSTATGLHEQLHTLMDTVVHVYVCRATEQSGTQQGVHSHPHPCSGPDPRPAFQKLSSTTAPRRPHGQGTMDPHGDFKDLKTPPPPSELSTQ